MLKPLFNTPNAILNNSLGLSFHLKFIGSNPDCPFLCNQFCWTLYLSQVDSSQTLNYFNLMIRLKDSYPIADFPLLILPSTETPCRFQGCDPLDSGLNQTSCFKNFYFLQNKTFFQDRFVPLISSSHCT